MLMINCFWWFILEQTEGRKGNGLDIIVVSTSLERTFT